MGLTTDLDLSAASVASLTSGDGVAAFFTSLGYRTGVRTPLSAEAIGLAGDAAAPIREIELIAEDDDGFMRVVLVHLKSLTAKCRTDLARVLGRTNIDHLLVLTSDFATFEFVLLDKRRREARGPIGGQRIQVVPLVFAVDRKGVASKELRTLRQFTWTTRDGLEQFDKLRRVFEAAAFTEDYFCNRALFADHYLTTRLREDSAWSESPAGPFQKVKDLLRDARANWYDKGEQIVRDELYEPLFKVLGFNAKRNKQADDDQTKPDYLLADSSGRTISAAFTYPWDRWLDGPDYQLDRDTPDENPGACVVTALEEGVADWIIVTNGRQWRLYSRHAHSRATNFYEIDLPETLLASGDTDPNEAFRYWWLFFRGQAFQPDGQTPPKCWLDHIATESREYAKELGERLKGRIFEQIFPHLARGFLEDRRHRLGIRKAPSDDELRDVFQGTLTLLYRLLFLLYAESRDLLPVREAPYRAASLKRIKQEIADKAGIAQTDVEEQITKAFSTKETMLYDRLQRLFAAMDLGDAALNVPTYNGGLFITRPDRLEAADSTQERELRIAQFLAEHKVPDRALALAIDLLSRDEDPKTFSLVFIDYKSLAVRHLGSIYEGLLEFKLQLAEEDLTTQTEKGKETFIPLGDAKKKRGKSPKVVVRKGEVYLSNDKAERKASGSYYTPDPIVTYIVAQTVGPVLAEKLEGLRKEFRKVRKTFDNEVQKATAFPVRKPDGSTWDAREFALEKVYVTHKDLVERLFDFRALDPAMGSGHFLVETVDFITDRILTFLNQFPINPVQVMLNRTRTNLLTALTDQGVTVDPAKLTDVNLLKRHVLKRCIYGVDLNPMAVELAKVSLWLDAFTLGAPLSFLNHHLRCGNSLVGATFADLRKALAGQLFGIDYEPLLRAIGHVLFVNKMADATAAEVKRSADEYDQARRDLSGYQIVLDLLVARHFGYPDAPDVLTHIGTELDLSSRARFEESLLITDRLLIQKVAEVARQPELRFFHWEIEFPEVFYGFADADERRLVHMDEIASGSAGFDAVIGNPPYDVLAEKELGVDLSALKSYIDSTPLLTPAVVGKQNLYKLFICRDLGLVRRNGQLGLIVPMPLLGDEQASGVRKLLNQEAALRVVEAFPQKDDPKCRVFEDAKLSTCIFVVRNSKEDTAFSVRVHPGKDIESGSPSLRMRRSDPALYDPENQPIIACSQEDWDLATRIMASGRMRRLADCCKAYQGEVNETTDRSRGFISDDSAIGPQVLRGSNVTIYLLRSASQGEALYLDIKGYLQGKRQDAKAWHHQHDRIGFQRNSPQNNFRRLIACIVPQGHFCCDTVSYIPEPESRLPLAAVSALLNSKLLDWYFRLASTNSKVNDYQFKTLPAPFIAEDNVNPNLVERFVSHVQKKDLGGAFAAIQTFLQEPPFSQSVVHCVGTVVEKIIEIETARGEIARSDRSSLAPEAQPLQDLLDHIFFRMAGLTDHEAAGLEDRLSRML